MTIAIENPIIVDDVEIEMESKVLSIFFCINFTSILLPNFAKHYWNAKHIFLARVVYIFFIVLRPSFRYTFGNKEDTEQ